MRISKGPLKRAFLKFHRFGLHFGVQILPAHYYSPAPNLLELERTKHRWARPSDLPGISCDLDEQVATLRSICLPYQSEYSGNATYREALEAGPGYGYIEAQALHAVVRHLKPGRIVEVGSGASTVCIVHAAERNATETGIRTEITAIEPNPFTRLKDVAAIELIRQPVQTVPLEVFTRLGQRDLLFIDSSHTVKPGGDVNYLILEVLPRLRPGVTVHFHDINYPYDYARDTCHTFLHWAEGSLLRAYLTFNSRARILVCMSLLHYSRKDALKEIFPEYDPERDQDGMRPQEYIPFSPVREHFPSSLYLEIL